MQPTTSCVSRPASSASKRDALGSFGKILPSADRPAVLPGDEPARPVSAKIDRRLLVVSIVMGGLALRFDRAGDARLADECRRNAEHFRTLASLFGGATPPISPASLKCPFLTDCYVLQGCGHCERCDLCDCAHQALEA